MGWYIFICLRDLKTSIMKNKFLYVNEEISNLSTFTYVSTHKASKNEFFFIDKTKQNKNNLKGILKSCTSNFLY